jgi:PA14 domain
LALFAFVLFLALGASHASAQQPQPQQQPVTLPPGWQQMAPTDFAAAIRSLVDQGTFDSLSQADKSAAAAYGKQLFLQINVAATTLSYQTLEMLHWVSRYSLPNKVVEQTRQGLLARQDNWTGQPYAEIRAKVMMLSRLQAPPYVLVSQAQKWVAAGGSPSQVPQADLKYDIVRQGFTNLNVITGSFSVQWSGQLNPPQTGNYTFSISPINVNSTSSSFGNTGLNSVQFPIQYTVSLSVAGQVILTASPGNWVTQSNAVNLTANQQVPLQMTVSISASQITPGKLHAMLYWQGPGIATSLVPQANLTLPDGSAQGLQATYTWTTPNGQTQTLTRTDAMIDCAWTTASLLLSQDTTIADQSSAAMWQAVTAPAFLTSLAGPPVQLHPFLQEPDDAAAGLSSANRQAFLNLLLQNPAVLAPADPKHMAYFFQAFRLGAPDQALSVFSSWASQWADVSSGFAIDRVFDGDARDGYRKMALYTTQELPGQVAQLQSGSLQLTDGRCCLPVAYTLAASYLGRGKLGQWIGYLDAQLNNSTLTGDLRVNWLLARSFAEEIRFSSQNLYVPLTSRALDGRAFLDQANQAAQSPGVKARVLKEIATRLIWAGEFQAATNLLQQATSSLPGAQQSLLAAWQQEISTLAAAAAQAQQNQAAAAQQAYLNTLKQRRDQAAAQGNTALVNRYNTLINAAPSSP